MIKFFGFLLFVFHLGACQKVELGSLTVSSLSNGSFEIYKVREDSSYNFTSIKVGVFNAPVPLEPGAYLLLTDCSYKNVVIHPGKKTEVLSHTIAFQSPLPSNSKTLFTVQCNRHKKTHPPQNISNQFMFNVFTEDVSLLVGMTPLSFDDLDTLETPHLLSRDLSALKLETGDNSGTAPYFVSPSDSHLSITQSQKAGRWILLSPGDYEVSLNGSKTSIHLEAKEQRIINTAKFELQVPKQTNFEDYKFVRGSPYAYEINELGPYLPKTAYNLLPGSIKVRLAGSSKIHEIELVEGKHTKFIVKRLKVDLGCQDKDWSCLGRREVLLYEGSSSYPFMKSVTDVPILYAASNISVELEGTYGLRYALTSKQNASTLKTGYVKIEPRVRYNSNTQTDFVRIEGANTKVSGYSYDIPYNRVSSKLLIAGRYKLSQYMRIQNPTESQRKNHNLFFNVLPGSSEHVLTFSYYLPERKYEAYKKTLSAKKKRS